MLIVDHPAYDTHPLTQESVTLTHAMPETEKIRKWISPPADFARPFEIANNSRTAGTATWLFDHPKFKKWLAQEGKTERGNKYFEENALWVRGIYWTWTRSLDREAANSYIGKPGSGKTTLAAATVEELAASSPSNWQSCPQVYFFFFDSKQPGLTLGHNAQRALLAQILRQHQGDRALLDRYAFAMDSNRYGQLSASPDEIFDLLSMAVSAEEPAIFVIDGVDECVDSEKMVRDLLLFSHNPCIKTILFSRPAGRSVRALLSAMPETQRLDTGMLASDDIRLYLTGEIDSLEEEDLIQPSETFPKARIVDQLVFGADGMFLWARLMIQHLKSLVFSPEDRLQIISDVSSPEGLGDMYSRILACISNGPKAECILAKDILMWLILCRRPMTSAELKQAAQLWPNSNKDSDYERFNAMAITLCAGLVEIDRPLSFEPRKAVFRLMHLTVTEYCIPQLKHTRSTGYWPYPVTDVSERRVSCEADIVTRSLNFITSALPTQPLWHILGPEVSRDDLDEHFPLASYSVSFWIDHIFSTASRRGALQPADCASLALSVSRFISCKLSLTAWVEASYVCSHPPEYEKLQQWATWASSHIQSSPLCDQADLVKDILELSAELQKLHQDWAAHLRRSPGIIWEQVPAFMKSRLFAQIATVEISHMVKDREKALSGAGISSQYLCKVSEINFEEQFVAVVSVWPSM